jgi:DNA-binding transcriptional MerR regulator
MSTSTSTGTGATHRSIGEVLNHLREEFPDITISKIRFLESQGLIDPERTPSGYRKFYEADVDRLRWILHQQKEHFLPLKVIKERLEHLDRGEDLPEDGGAATSDPAADADGAGAPVRERPRRGRSKQHRAASLPIDEPVADPEEPEPAQTRAVPSGGVSLTRTELAKAAGLDEAQVADLESFGLLTPSTESAEQVLFDEEALAVARIAAGFGRHGIEARHLRMYKHFAEREASLFQQVLLPYMRQRNPDARVKAKEQLADLARLGRGLRAALLVDAAREALGD